MQNFPNLPIDDTQDLYSDIDNPYYPPGKTPKYMYVSITGVQPGSKYYSESFPYLPPEGTFKCLHTDWDLWYYGKDSFYCMLVYMGGNIIKCIAGWYFDETDYQAFYGKNPAWPYFADINKFEDYEGSYFYGGACSITWMPPEVPNPVSVIADACGIEREPKMFYQGIAQTATKGTYRYARRKDKTCIRILVDKSA